MHDVICSRYPWLRFRKWNVLRRSGGCYTGGRNSILVVEWGDVQIIFALNTCNHIRISQSRTESVKKRINHEDCSVKTNQDKTSQTWPLLRTVTDMDGQRWSERMSRDSCSVRSSHDSGQVVQIAHDFCVFGEMSKHAQVVYALFVTVFTLTVIYVNILVLFQITCYYEVVSLVGFGSASNVNDSLN